MTAPHTAVQIPDAAVQAALDSWNSEQLPVVRDVALRNAIAAAYPHLPLGYEVKQLEWSQKAPALYESEPFLYWAAGIGGYYRAEPDGTLWMAHDPFIFEKHKNQTAAKAAAQADFEHRVRGCLVPSALRDAIEIVNYLRKVEGHDRHTALDAAMMIEYLAKSRTKPVDVAAVRRQASEEAYWQAEDILTKERTKRHKQYDDYTGEDYTQKERYRVAVQVLNIVIKEIRALSAEPAQGEQWQPTHRHVKRGTEYQLIGNGKMQADSVEIYTPHTGYEDFDMGDVAIYRGEDGELWARPIAEFNDGRFEPLPAAPTSEAGR